MTAIRWIYAFIDRPAARLGAAGEFWTAVTGTTLSAPRGAHGEFATLLPTSADACLKIQAVGDSGGVHLDLCVEDIPDLVRRAKGAGATTVAAPDGYVVLRSPGGQLCCAVPWHGEARRPAPVGGPGGITSRLDQVSVDVAPSVFAAEVAFWTALTGWDSVGGALPEFHLVKPPPDLPVRIMVQRLGEQRPTSAHLDLACSDVAAARAWHEQLGASAVDERPLWTVMRDPAGGVYCLTVREPETGSLPSWAHRRR